MVDVLVDLNVSNPTMVPISTINSNVVVHLSKGVDSLAVPGFMPSITSGVIGISGSLQGLFTYNLGVNFSVRIY